MDNASDIHGDIGNRRRSRHGNEKMDVDKRQQLMSNDKLDFGRMPRNFTNAIVALLWWDVLRRDGGPNQRISTNTFIGSKSWAHRLDRIIGVLAVVIVNVGQIMTNIYEHFGILIKFKWWHISHSLAPNAPMHLVDRWTRIAHFWTHKRAQVALLCSSLSLEQSHLVVECRVFPIHLDIWAQRRFALHVDDLQPQIGFWRCAWSSAICNVSA